jgi:hypothetical protein
MIILLTLYLILFLLLIRNFKVHSYRGNIIVKIGKRNIQDIDKGTYGSSRWDVFDSVGYNEMLLKFWRPFDSFFPGDFLKDLEN